MTDPKRFILFLDFDGVLCTLRHAIAVGDRGVLGCLDPVALDFLNRICRENKIYIIISSTWRLGEKFSKFSDIFKATGHFDIVNSLYYNDYATPHISNKCRGTEIENWLGRNDDLVLDFLILDDESDVLDYQRSRLIKTDGDNGLLMVDYIAIEKTIKLANNMEYKE